VAQYLPQNTCRRYHTLAVEEVVEVVERSR
jgi:hypothetical protein